MRIRSPPPPPLTPPGRTFPDLSAADGAPPAAGDVDRRALRLAMFALLTLVVAGALCVPMVARNNLRYASFFYPQFAAIEPIALGLTTIFLVGVWLVARRAARPDDTGPTSASEEAPALTMPRWRVGSAALAVALLAFAIAAVGTAIIFHHFLFVDDEYAAWFQAVIFSHGARQAVVSPGWCRWIASLTPDDIATSGCRWHLGFLPIHSLVSAAFIALHLDGFTGPTLAAVSVLLIAAVARKAWPDRPDRAWLAVAIFATSTQILFMSMTMYAMPTHLVFSLIWLWLYLDDRRWAILLLPWVGFLAMGVHSPTPHLMLVPPFWIRYVRQRRWGVATYVAAVYALGMAFWIAQLSQPAFTAAVASPAATFTTASGNFSRPGGLEAITTVMHLALVATWNTPIATLLLVAVLLAWKRLDPFTKDLGLSFLLVIILRVFVPTPQGGGWGYRYIYAALGNFALLAACGMDVMARAIGKRRATQLLVTSLAMSVLIQIPMRAVQVQRVIRPYYLLSTWMASLPQKIVVLPAEGIMWGSDLVRNDPFLTHGNIIMSLSLLGPDGFSQLEQRYPGQVRLVHPAEVVQFGVERAPLRLGPLLIGP